MPSSTALCATVAMLAVAVSSSEYGVDTYELVDCPAVTPYVQTKVDGRPGVIAMSTNNLGGQADSSPWSMNVSAGIGGIVGLFANPATRKKVVVTYGNTSYVGGNLAGRAISVSDPWLGASVTKMLTGAVFLHYHRDLFDTPFLASCGLECGVPQNFIDAFLSGSRANVTFREIFDHTSGLPDFFTDFGAGVSVNGTTMPPFQARILKDELGADRRYMAPEDLCNFTAVYLGAYPKTRGQFHYSNDGYILIGMAVEYLQRQRLSTLINKLFDDYVPCSQDLTCTLQFEADMPSWQAYATSDPGPRSPVELNSAVVPVSNYFLLNGRWYDLSRESGSVQGDELYGPPFYNTATKSRWATAGVVCSAASLANFMIALSQGSIPNVYATDFWESGNNTGSPGLLGKNGFGGAGGYYDPRSSRGLIISGITNISPNNDGIKGLYESAVSDLVSCLSGASATAVVEPSCRSSGGDDGGTDEGVLIGAVVGGTLGGLALAAVIWYFTCSPGQSTASKAAKLGAGGSSTAAGSSTAVDTVRPTQEGIEIKEIGS